MLKSSFDHTMVWSVNHRAITATFVAIITVLAVIGYTRPQLVRNLFLSASTGTEQADDGSAGQADDYQPVPDIDPVSLSRSDAVIVVQSPSFFTSEGAKAMRHVVKTLEDQDYIHHILWMDRVPILNIFGLSEPLFPRSEASNERFAAARDKAMKHPLVGGHLVSEDGQTMLLLVTFDWDFVRNDEQCTVDLRTISENAAASFPEVPLKFLITGDTPARITYMKAHEANQLKYQLIGYGVIAIMAVILFRGLRAVLIVSLAPIVGVFWTMGFLRFFQLQDNPFNDVILPVLISLVGLTDGVHLTVQIRKLRAAGLSERMAARDALHDVGYACMLTSVTTAIGFGSLSLASNVWVKDFGWCSVIGVFLTFTSVVTIVPLVCSTRLGRNIHLGHEKSLIDRNLTRISGLIDIVLKRPRSFASAGVILTVILLAISLTLRPDQRRSNSLPETSEANIAMVHMDKALGGLEFSEVEVTWSSDVPASSPEILQTIAEVDDLLATEPMIGYPLSVRNLVDALPGEGPTEERMSMIELLPPQLKRAFYTPERRHAAVTFRVQDVGIARFDPVFRRLEAGLLAIQSKHPEFQLKLSGSAIWRWENLYQIVIDLATSLGSASIIIFITLTIAYRSIRIGLISIVPNVLPLAATGAWLVWKNEALELVSVCAFTVCLGIVVDDSIHFLSRYDAERRTALNRKDAIRKAFGNVGIAMVMTTVVLVAGFGTVAFSDSRDHHIFASMGAITIAAALICDLIVLPAMLACFADEVGGPANEASLQNRDETAGTEV
jgi:predicted RND superfamily exporter protein